MLKVEGAKIFAFAKGLLAVMLIATFVYKIGGIALGLQPPLDRETVLSGLIWLPITCAGTVFIISLFNGWIALRIKADR